MVLGGKFIIGTTYGMVRMLMGATVLMEFYGCLQVRKASLNMIWKIYGCELGCLQSETGSMVKVAAVHSLARIAPRGTSSKLWIRRTGCFVPGRVAMGVNEIGTCPRSAVRRSGAVG